MPLYNQGKGNARKYTHTHAHIQIQPWRAGHQNRHQRKGDEEIDRDKELTDDEFQNKLHICTTY